MRDRAEPNTSDFSEWARGSLAELSTQFEIAVRTQMMRPDVQLSDLIGESARILQALILSLEATNARSKGTLNE